MGLVSRHHHLARNDKNLPARRERHFTTAESTRSLVRLRSDHCGSDVSVIVWGDHLRAYGGHVVRDSGKGLRKINELFMPSPSQHFGGNSARLSECTRAPGWDVSTTCKILLGGECSCAADTHSVSLATTVHPPKKDMQNERHTAANKGTTLPHVRHLGHDYTMT